MENTMIMDKMDILESITTSNESKLHKMTELTSGNGIAASHNSTVSKFSAVFETKNNYKAHPFAEIFPDATNDEYERLLEDMRVHGQYEPVIIFEGRIADGRTRQMAQQELNYQLLVHEWLGTPEELLNYLYAKTQHRNLTSQQRAVISLQFLKAERQLAQQRKGMRTDLQQIVTAVKGRASEITAKRHGTNRTYLGYAEKIQEKAEELLEFVKKNEIPISQAKLLAEQIDTPEQRIEAIGLYKRGKQTMKAIIDEIKFKRNPAHDVSEEQPGTGIQVDIVPALLLFQSLHLWNDKDNGIEKIKQIANILNIDTREIWYVPDTEEKTAKEISKLIQALVKKMKKIRRFSPEGQEVIKNIN